MRAAVRATVRFCAQALFLALMVAGSLASVFLVGVALAKVAP